MLNPIDSRLASCSTFTSVVTSIFHPQYVSPSFYPCKCIVYDPVNRPVCLCTCRVCSVRCDGCTVVSDTTVQPSGKSLFTVTGNANAAISFTLFGHCIEVALNRLKVKSFVRFNFTQF